MTLENIDDLENNNIQNRLNEIQANILKPHGREEVALVFITLRDNASDLCTWLAQMAEEITTAEEHNKRSSSYKNMNQKDAKAYDEIVLTLSLSSTGFIKLNLPFLSNSTGIFQSGMKDVKRLKDRHYNYWEDPFKENLDILISLAGNSHKKLEKRANEIKLDLIQKYPHLIAKDPFVQFGKNMYAKFYGQKHKIEPFGYREGLSKVRFFRKYEKNKHILLKDRWKIALDRQGGSYLVFRKLLQNVSEFNSKVKELSVELGQSQEIVEAQVMGRFKDGRPLTFHKKERMPRTNYTRNELGRMKMFDDYNVNTSKNNEAGFEEDQAGLRCPFHAHIRKVNPRKKSILMKDTGYPGDEVPKRIIRRGIPFDEGNNKVGLLFMCYQQNIRNHFFHVYKEWMNKADFPDDSRMTGVDPLSSVFYSKSYPYKPRMNNNGQYWNLRFNDALRRKVSFNLTHLVDFIGGEYFYTPNINFLKNLCDFQKSSLKS